MTEEIGGLVLAIAAGAVLGTAYFGALWLTVRRLARTSRPALLLVGGAACRLVLLATALYPVMDGRWDRLVAGLAGFVLARVVLTRRLGAQPRPSVP